MKKIYIITICIFLMFVVFGTILYLVIYSKNSTNNITPSSKVITNCSDTAPCPSGKICIDRECKTTYSCADDCNPKQ